MGLPLLATTAGVENGRSHKKGPQLTGQEETRTSFLQAPGTQHCQEPESPRKWILPQALPRRQPGQQPDFDPVRPKTGQTSHWPTVLWDRDLLVSVSLSVCPTLCDPMDCSPPGSSVHGILQAGTLEWVAMPSSRGSSQPRDWTWVSCIAGGFFTTMPSGKPLVRPLRL